MTPPAITGQFIATLGHDLITGNHDRPSNAKVAARRRGGLQGTSEVQWSMMNLSQSQSDKGYCLPGSSLVSAPQPAMSSSAHRELVRMEKDAS